MSKADDLHVAAARLVRLRDVQHSIQDWDDALNALADAVGEKGDPAEPVVVKNDDGSTTTTFWDGSTQLVDADGTTHPRTSVEYVRAPWVAEEEAPVEKPAKGFTTADAAPKEK